MNKQYIRKTLPIMLALSMLFTSACSENNKQSTSSVQQGKHRDTRLHDAALDGNIEKVERLINENADVNATVGSIFWPFGFRQRTDFTPLMAAAEKGHLDIAKKLIEAGADLNMKGNIEWASNVPALVLAMVNKHTEVVKELINAGADVNIDCGYANRSKPLNFACPEDIRKILVEHGAVAKKVEATHSYDDDGSNACYISYDGGYIQY